YEILYNGNYVDVTNLKDGDDLYKNTYKEIMKGQYPTRETIKDSNSQTTVIEKDETGDITKKTNPDGSSVECKYDEKDNLTEEFNNANGHQIKTTYVYDEENIYLQSVEKGTSNDKSNETYTYDDSSNIKGLVKTKATTRDSSTNVVVNYTYNENGELTQEEIGNRNTYLAHSYGFFTEDKTIEINGKAIIVEKPNNEYEKGIYYVLVKVKPEGNIEITQYDKKLNPIKITQSNSDGTEKSTTLIVYDEYGRKIREVKPEVYAENPKTADNLTEGCHIYKYNNSGLVIEEVDDENNTTSYNYDSKGNLSEEIEPGNTKYSYEYDAMDRLITKSYKDEGDLKKLESFAYERGTEKSSSNKAFKQTHVEKIDDENELRTETYFDYAGRETIIENQYKIIEKEYYGDGNIKRESVYEKINDGKVCVSDVLYFYNDKGLLDVTLTAYELGKTRTYFITKNIYTNDNLLKYEIKYLDAQEVDTTKNTVSLPEEAKASVIKYDYDEIGNVTSESTYIGLFSLSNLSTIIFAKKVEKSYDIPNNKITETSGDIKTEYTY
ncbi:MAG: RHS repeat protein, partial [Crenarchaeota archaeon]|nr:RHS repeat protein [Thermoproteota archaeon]